MQPIKADCMMILLFEKGLTIHIQLILAKKFYDVCVSVLGGLRCENPSQHYK
jgi:hypothetical protein